MMVATLFAIPGKGLGAGMDVPALVSIAILLVVIFLPLLLKRDGPPGQSDSDTDDGWGNGPRPPQTPPDDPWGGIPLDDALPGRARLRGHARLADLLPSRSRRPAREPDRPPSRRPTPAGH
jgi:hypothetical protein